MTAFDPARLLAVWEAGARRHPIDRALLLFALAAPQRDPDALADAPLGERNAAIMGLREACFGGPLQSWVDCPACGERMEFDIHPAMLPPPPAQPLEAITVGDLRFAPPTSRRLAKALDAGRPEDAALNLLRDCVLDDAAVPDAPDELAQLMDAAGAAIDAADPWAELTLALPCPACGTRVDASFDVAAYFWDELSTHAQRLLDDIHVLASAYGWTEPEILALGDTRRAAYLDRVRA